MPKKGANRLLRAIEIELDVLDSWALEFCDKLDDSGVWIKTNYGWYRLLNPAPEYKYLYEDLHARFEITLKVFAALIGPNGATMVFKDMARELKERYGITDKELIDNAVFIAKHLRATERLDRIGFIRSLEITHAFFHKGLYKLGSAYQNKKKKRTFNEVKAESSRPLRSNDEHSKPADISSDDSDVEEQSKSKRRKLTHHNNNNNAPSGNLFVTKSRQYNGVRDYSSIPARYLSEDKRRLLCFVCSQTMRVEEVEQFVKHVNKHRSNLVGEMLDKDRVAFRLQSFLNQSRVRNFIETSLASDAPISSGIELPLADLPSQVNMTMRALKRRSFNVERPSAGQLFESEHQPPYREIYREEAIEEVVVDSTNHKSVPASNRYGNVRKAQKFDVEDIDDEQDEEVQYSYRPYSREDDDDEEEEDEEDEDEDFFYRFEPPAQKPKPKSNRRSSRSGQRLFASAQQLEKERQKREQKNAIQALEVLVAREILDAVETLPAIETSRDIKLREDLSNMLLPSDNCAISPAIEHTANESNQSNNSNEIESNSTDLGSTIVSIKGNSPNIALCTSNEVMVKQ
jgi:hypothetical protein